VAGAERHQGSGVWRDWFALTAIVCGLLFLLHCYGTALLPFVPDESLFLQPAHGLAVGKGMGTPALDDLLPGIARRTYWQPPLYFLVAAAWGKLAGFEIVAMRWLSRLCAVGVIVLLWLLARQWGLERGWALLCVLWTALDLAFQYDANIARMDMLSALWLMGCLSAFTLHQRDGKEWQAGVAGVLGALATLTHLITLPTVTIVGLVLGWQRRKRSLVWFVLPIVMVWVFGLFYAAQDWQSWWGQLGAQFLRKGEAGLEAIGLRLLFLQSLLPLFGVFATNMLPIWFPLVFLSLWSLGRKSSPLTLWQTSALSATYMAAALGGEVWYIGWWTPFGALLLGCWLNALSTQWSRHKIRWMVLGILLVGWQGVKVAQVWASLSTLSGDINRFFAEVQGILPEGATVILHSIPDPFPVLQRTRHDLRLIQLSPTPMVRQALERNFQRAQYLVGITGWVKNRTGIALGTVQKEWRFRASAGTWVVRLHRLHRKPVRLP
jgi:hypothetical protein